MAKRKTRVHGVGVMSNQDWQTEEDLRTLQRACEIRKDPKRLKKAQELAKEKLGELALVAAEEY